MSEPFLVILPVRNGSAYIRKAIASILEQTDRYFRLIILENSSDDDTYGIVSSFNDPRLEVLTAPHALPIEENWGRARAVLETVSYNTLVTFIGHDDYLHPYFVELMRQAVQENNEATLYHCHFDLIDSAGNQIRPCRPIPERETWRDLAAMLAWDMRDAYGTGYVFRAGDYLKVGGMPPFPGILYADHLLFLRLTQLGYKHAAPFIGCAYRLHQASMSNAVSISRINQRLRAFGQFLDALENEFSDWTADDKGRAAMLTLLAREHMVFNNPMVRGALDAENRDRVTQIARRINAQGGSADLRHWAYQASRSVRTLGRLRRAIAYSKARLKA